MDKIFKNFRETLNGSIGCDYYANGEDAEPYPYTLSQEELDSLGEIEITPANAEDKAAAAKEAARLAAKAELDATLDNLTYTLPDGRVIQTRPRDQQWLMGGIEIGGDEWVLADNTTALVTAEELQEALMAAKLAVKAAFDAYKAKL